MAEPQDRSAAAIDAQTNDLPHLLAVFARAEFKAPVEAIVGLINLLAEDCGAGPGEALRQDVEKLRTAALGLETIVSGLLDPANAEQQIAGQAPEGYSSVLRHELRTPITAILGYGELLVEEAGEGLQSQIGIVHDIADAARRLLGQIDAMVEFIKLNREARGSSTPSAIDQHPDLVEPIEAIRSVLLETKPYGPKVTGRVLVVDDNGSTLDLLSRRLGREGHEVTTCDSGEAALKKLEASPYDLVLLDLLMPGLSGIEVLRRMKAQPETAALPVIIISALDEVDSTVRCIEAGADDYLTKPINPVLLRARVAATLDRKFLRDRDQAITEQLRIEQNRSESLLRNVLPESVVARLQQGEKVIADHFEEATILFSDLVGFTALTSKLAPDRVLDLLNRIFSGFDVLAADHGLEKIKTIGDAYMAAAGLPEKRADHARAVAAMALRMPAVVQAASLEFGQPLGIRIGLHTGPVAAGIIGQNKFIYDVWGDTVNIASRMEHYGEPGRVHISAQTRAAIGNAYPIETRQPIDVKGRGWMSTFFLCDRPRAA